MVVTLCYIMKTSQMLISCIKLNLALYWNKDGKLQLHEVIQPLKVSDVIPTSL